VLVVLEGLQELVVLGEGLAPARLRQVERPVLQLFPPESGWLLPVVACARVDQLLQFLVVGDLVPGFEAERLPEVVVYVFGRNCHAILVVHDELSYLVLVQWLLVEGGLARCLVESPPRLLLLPPLLVLQRQLHFLQVLHK
jgi:hypothetical protein